MDCDRCGRTQFLGDCLEQDCLKDKEEELSDGLGGTFTSCHEDA